MSESEIESHKESGIKKKRKRTVLSQANQHKLEWYFQQEAWPNRPKKEKIALEVGKDETFISTWFQNRRAKQKREDELCLYSSRMMGEKAHQIKVSVKDEKILMTMSMRLGRESKNGKMGVDDNIDDSDVEPVVVPDAPTSSTNTSEINSENETVTDIANETCCEPNTKSCDDFENDDQFQKENSSVILSQIHTSDTEEEPSIMSQDTCMSDVPFTTCEELFISSTATNSSTETVCRKTGKIIHRAPIWIPQIRYNVSEEDLNVKQSTGSKAIKTKENIQMSKVSPNKICSSMSNMVMDTKDPYMTSDKYMEKNTRKSLQQSVARMKITTGKGTNPAVLMNNPQLNSTSTKSPNPATLFRAIISMMSVAEGGIVDPADPDFSTAVNDALYGIQINGDSRLVYDKDYGLDLVDLHDSNSLIENIQQN